LSPINWNPLNKLLIDLSSEHLAPTSSARKAFAANGSPVRDHILLIADASY
jgi:hypothetical protein